MSCDAVFYLGTEDDPEVMKCSLHEEHKGRHETVGKSERRLSDGKQVKYNLMWMEDMALKCQFCGKNDVYDFECNDCGAHYCGCNWDRKDDAIDEIEIGDYEYRVDDSCPKCQEKIAVEAGFDAGEARP